MTVLPSEVITGDCLEVLTSRSPTEFDLIVADPPYNIGYEYDVHRDDMTPAAYASWTEDWLGACLRTLRPGGTIWVAIGHEFVHRMRVILEDKFGMLFRHHVIWHYSFGTYRKRDLTRSHTHFLHYVKGPGDSTWNVGDILEPSKRMETGDKRAKPEGRPPDDVWSYKRIAGTHKERIPWHPCHLPEAIVARIIRVSSNRGDKVLDPFSGSGTTGVVAKKLGREFLGIELSPDYAAKSIDRIATAAEGDPIVLDLPRMGV